MKVVVGLVAVLGLGWLFLRTAQNARSAPYTVRVADMERWEVVEGPDAPGGAIVGLRPPSAMTADLFKQIFARNMESIASPATVLAPIVLRRESVSLGGAPEGAVVAAARASGIEAATLVPRCLAARRADPPASYDYYFVLFEPAPFHEARTEVRTAHGAEASAFAPTALVPSLVIATSDPAARSILPFEPDPDRDCVAPVTLD